MSKHVVVVGGGIAGLATAYYLGKSGVQVTLIEKDNRLGGKVITDQSDGFVIEGGPDSFITQKPWALQLARELGLEDNFLGTNDDRRETYILRRRKLNKIPHGLHSIVPTRLMPLATSRLISWFGKLRMGMDLFIKPKTDYEDESLADFIRRRLGKEALEVLAEPMLAGIHVSDAETLSLLASFPRFRDTERQYGSLTRGMVAARKMHNQHKAQHANGTPHKHPSMFMTFKGGLTRLIEALRESIQGEILTGKGVTALTKADAGYQLTLDDGHVIQADAVVLATPSYVAAKLLQAEQPDLAQKLAAIRYVSTATVSIGYRKADFQHPLNGFGFVIPRTEPTRLLACTWTSTKFDHRAPDEHVLLRVFVGGPRREELVSQDDDTLVQLVRDELKTIMGIEAEPTIARVFRWNKSNPQYEVGHLERIDEIESLCPAGIYVTGSAYRGVGMPDCIHQGLQTAEKIIETLQ